MRQQRRRDTAPEIAVRRILFGDGARYRVNYPVPGLTRRTIDIAFTRARLAVFIDGCFWHNCPLHGTRPQANGPWWAEKLAANCARDASTTAHLVSLGWRVLRFYEHEDPRSVAKHVMHELGSTRT